MATQLRDPTGANGAENGGSPIIDLTGELHITGESIMERHCELMKNEEIRMAVEREMRVRNVSLFKQGPVYELLREHCHLEAQSRRSRRAYDLERSARPHDSF